MSENSTLRIHTQLGNDPEPRPVSPRKGTGRRHGRRGTPSVSPAGCHLPLGGRLKGPSSPPKGSLSEGAGMRSVAEGVQAIPLKSVKDAPKGFPLRGSWMAEGQTEEVPCDCVPRLNYYRGAG